MLCDTFAAGTTPVCSWLYFSVRWARNGQAESREDDSAGAFGPQTVVTHSPGDAPRAAHFACRTTGELLDWVLGLREATREADEQRRVQEAALMPADLAAHSLSPAPADSLSAGGVGALLWQVMSTKVAEQARDNGRRPLQMLAQVVRQAAGDHAIVKNDMLRVAQLSRAHAAQAPAAAAAASGQPPVEVSDDAGEAAPSTSSTPTKGKKKAKKKRGGAAKA